MPIYNRKSPRIKGYDYTQPNAYFVTICTHERHHFFGDIVDSHMHLTAIGHLAHQFWLTIPDHFNFVRLDSHVVMPNHVHGILIITHNINATYEPAQFAKPIAQSLSSVIRAYKGQVTYQARQVNPDVGILWQGSYHEHIIRQPDAYQRIREYILNNPRQWQTDRFYQ